MPQSELKKFIQDTAQKLGFTHIGFSAASVDEIKSKQLKQWLDNGYHASMQWMENRIMERSNIFKYYPNAKTIISTSMNYFTGNANNNKNIGKISNYAWGDDYHKIIKSKLFQLLRKIQTKEPSINGLACVDTSPIMEKSWAQKSGIGWIGKHTNLITKSHGSWVFLGEIILDVELKPDQEFIEDLCGTCTACLDACPTNAFPQPYVLDSTKCISYHTIEHRGKFNDDIELSNWIYGCDICQEVCPWNIKFANKTTENSFKPRKELIDKNLNDWELLTEKEFKNIFKNSPIKRTKFQGLKRNISTANQTN